MVATTLKQREIAIIGYNTDDPGGIPSDTISFVLLAPIGSGTQIFFTDRAWNGTTFAAAGGGDGTFTYMAVADLPAGTIVTITQAQLNAAGINLSDAGEAIYVYQGAIDAPVTFLYAADIADNNTTFNGSLVNTGLSVANGTATAIAGDNGTFGDRGHNIQTGDLLTSISSPTNWTSNDDSPQNPITGNLLSAPDQYVFTVIAGDAGLLRMSRDGANVATQALHQFQTNPNPATQFNHPNDIVFDTVHGLFFIADTDTGNRRILQGNIADLFNPGTLPTLTVLYSDADPATSHGQINGLAIDVDHATGQGALYFVNQDDLLRVVYDHDGTSPTNQTPVLLASVPAGQFANELTLDIATGRAWIVSTAAATEPITVPAGTPGAIFDPDSGTWYIVATNITNNEIYQVANLARSDTNATGNTVVALDLNGATAGTDLVDEQGLLSSVDVDPVTGHVYFTAIQINNGINGAVGGIYRYNLATGVVEILYTEGNATDYLFKYIDVDPETGRYYVTNNSFESPGDINGTANNTSSVMFHATSAGTPTVFHANAGNINAGVPWGLIVDNAPTLTGTNLNPGQTETAGNPSPNPAAVTPANAFTAMDIDTDLQVDQLGGAQVRISAGFQTGAGHQDVLTIGGLTSGTFSAGAAGAAQDITFSYNSTTGVMTLTGASTFVGYQAALAAVQFQANGDNPTNYGANGSRTISYSVTDGLMYSDEVHATVTVTGINDAPVNANAGADSGAEDTTFNIAGLSVVDVDANPAAGGGQDLTVTLTVTRGTLNLNTGVAGGIVSGDIVGGAQGTNTITIQASAAEINATFANATGVQFTGGTNVNGTVTLTMVTNDNGFSGNDAGLSGTGTTEQDSDNYTITVTAVNDAPTVSGDGTEDAAAIQEDVPLTNLNAPTVATLFGGQFSDALDDQTAFPGGSSPNTFAGIAVITNGSSGATGQWQYWTGAAWQNIGSPGAGSATFVRADALLRFEPALNYNGNAPTLTAHLVDNSAGSPTTNGASINLIVTPPGGTSPVSNGTVTLSQAITAVNDAPVNTVPGTLNLSEDAVNVVVAGLSVNDVEAGPAGQPLTVTLSVARGTITINTGIAGGIDATHVSGGAPAASNQTSITITATQAQINATLAGANGLTYTPTSNVNGNDTLTIFTSDLGYTGTGGTLTDTDMRTLNVGAVNDAPTIGDGTESVPAINEDTPNTSGNAQTVDVLFGPQFSDATDQVAGGSSANTLLGIAIVANGSNANGTWEWLNGGVWTAIGAASQAAAKTFTAATQIRFNPASDFNGTAPTLTAHLVDNSSGTITNGSTVNLSAGGATGGTTRYSAGTVVLSQDVTAINDAPVNTVPGPLTINEDATNVAVTGIQVADVEAGPAGQPLTVTLSVAHGTIHVDTTNGAGVGAGQVTGNDSTSVTITATQAQINATLAGLNGLTYTPTGNFNGSDTLQIVTSDAGYTGAGGTPTDTDTVTINITPVNDAPTVSGDGTEDATTILEDTPSATGQSVSSLFGGQYSDAADNQVPGGGASSAGAFTGIAVTANGSSVADGQWQYHNGAVWVDIGAVSDAAAKLFGEATMIRFNPAFGFSGTAPTLTVHLIDNAGPAIVNATAVDLSGVGATGGTTRYSANTVVLSQEVTPGNEAPVVDLNGADAGLDFASAYTEDGTAAVIADTDVSITDADVGDGVTGATITITDAIAGDQLTVVGALPGSIVAVGGGTATLTLSGTGTQAEYQQALTQIVYSSTSNDPNVGGTDLTRSVTVTVTDGITPSAAATTTVTLTGSNDPPAGTDATITAIEDTPRLLAQADFGFTDPDSADALSAVTITGVTGGTLYYDADGTGGAGLPVAVGSFPQTYTAAELAAGNVSYQANSNLNGTGVGTISFQVIDNSGAPNNTDLSVNTLTVDVTPINDQPDIPNSPTVTTDEQVAVTLNAAITVSDIDLDARNGGAGDYSGAAFAINRSVSDAEDVFSFDTAGAQFTVNGSNLESGGNVIATLAQAGGILNINFANNGTVPTTALVNDVLQHLQYTNTSNEPPASVTLLYIIDDGAPGGGQGALGAPFNNIDGGQVIININSVNDAPSGADKLITIDEDANQVLTIADFGFSDIDNDIFDSAVVVSVTGGTILVDDGNILTPPVSLTSGTISAADIAAGYVSFQPTAHLNGSGAGAISFQVVDNGGIANSGQNTDQSANTITFDIDSVNDAPSGTDNTVTGSEDDPYVFTLADFGYSDTADSDAFSGVIFTTVPTTGTLFYDADGPGGAAPVMLADGAGPIAAADIAAGKVYFVPVTDAFGSPYASFTFQVQDDGGITNGGVDTDQSANTMVINIAPDNLPPVVDLDGATGGVNYTASYTEDAPGVAIGSGVTVSDPDSGFGDMIESAVITLTDKVTGDALTLTGVLPPGFLAVTNIAAGSITLTITGSGTGAQYQALIESILYSTTNQNPTVGGTDAARTITVVVNDGTINSATATTTVNITALDDAPVAQPDSYTITESGMIVGGNLFADNGSGTDSDPDGPPLAVSAVGGGPGANVGTPFTLDSGATLTVRADGTFDYNPGSVFLPTPTAGSGASNTPSHDSFTYTVAGGNTVTVNIALTGLDTNDLLLGTSGADTMDGGIGHDTLLGDAGADILFGGAGNDVIDGGTGIDGMYGGTGNDVFNVDQASDYLVEASSEGTDLVYTSVSYGLTAGVEVEILSTTQNSGIGAIHLYGNEFDNVIYGNAGANLLSGDGGNDVLVGLGGNDLLIGDDGNDTLDGGAGNNTLLGGAGVDILLGGDNEDVLDGGTGADGLYGGDGNDSYYVDQAGDFVLEAANRGTDIVYASADYALAAGASVEILSTTQNAGTDAIDLTGNELDNVIYGNAGMNLLIGGAGNDLLVGLGGDDRLIGDNGTDLLDGGDGNDTLLGGALADTLLGGDGDDVIDGGTGADSASGGDGNDVYLVDEALDAALETSGQGTDAVYAAVSYTLTAGSHVEILSTTQNSGTGAINLTGNELANVLYGNNGVNVLNGGDGNDALIGLGDADTFQFTTALGANNVDQIADFVHGTDKIALDDAVFTALSLGALANASFHVGATATDEDQRILYDSTNGNLYYDADGTGAIAAILFANLQGNPILTASDFQVI